MSVHLRLLPFYKEATAFLLYECNIVKLVRRSHVFPKKNLAPLASLVLNFQGQNCISFYAAKIYFGQERHWFWPTYYPPQFLHCAPPSLFSIYPHLARFLNLLNSSLHSHS